MVFCVLSDGVFCVELYAMISFSSSNCINFLCEMSFWEVVELWDWDGWERECVVF